MTSAPPKSKRPAAWLSAVAGMTAGGIEGATTYPVEYLKTRAQFASAPGGEPLSPIAIARATIAERGISGLYAGCGALVAGNALKAGVRFLSYDEIKSYLVDDAGKLTPARSVLAGLGAGCCEAALAVTPSETIKTKLIDDAKLSKPKYSGLVQGTLAICREEGFAGIYRGLGPTMAKQGANSAVRFTSYNTIKGWVGSWTGATTANLSAGLTFAVGAAAGIITVYTTMPIDNVKTRMQSLEARKNYRNSFHCAVRIWKEEGVLQFWRGATPRLVRLSMSGGITFFVYERVVELLTSR